MPQPKKRKTAGGEDRWDVRTRIGRRVVTRTFVRKRDATAYASTIEADKLRGVAVDPRRARITLGEYGWRWLRMRTDLRPRRERTTRTCCAATSSQLWATSSWATWTPRRCGRGTWNCAAATLRPRTTPTACCARS